MNASVKFSGKKPQTFAGKIFSSIFFFIFLVIGGAIFSVIAYISLGELGVLFWKKMPCRIISSRIETEQDRGHAKHIFRINYSYEYNGTSYNSCTVSRGYSGGSSYNNEQALLAKYPAGSQGSCLVNPGNPSVAVLEMNRTAFYMFPFALIPFIFMLVGAGGIYSTWTGWSPFSSSRENNSSSMLKGEHGILALFSIFFIIGIAVFYFIGIVPTMRVFAAKEWKTVTCRIISSEVGRHHARKGSTYSIDIMYSYVIDGKEYRSNRYNFMSGSSSGYEGKKRVVDNYPAGSERTCYVNPEDPCDSVLYRGFSLQFLLALIPLVFVIIGASGIIYNIRKLGRRSDGFGDYDNRSLNDYSTGEICLKPVNGPFNAFLGSLFLAVFWNGIVSIFIWQCALSWMKGKPEWFLTIFLLPFVALGLLFIFLLFTSFISLFNPRPKIFVNTRTPAQGGKFKIQWHINERSARIFKYLSITLLCRAGSSDNARTKYAVLQSLPIVETDDQLWMSSGSKELVLPENVPVDDNCHWVISLKAQLYCRPKIELDYPIRILLKC